MTRLTIEVDQHTLEALSGIGAAKEMSLEHALSYIVDRTLFGKIRRLAVPADQYTPQQVPVFVDETADRIKKQFRCSVCGNVVFAYYGSLKLIANGQFDADNNMVGGDETDWFSKLGVPTEFVCPGRVLVETPAGRVIRRRCATIYQKVGA